MQNQYDAKALSLKSILGIGGEDGQLYVAPFQRPYKWTEENIDDFFTDVFEDFEWRKIKAGSSRTKHYHYMGAIVLQDEEDGGERYSILDGQQRLVTLTLILGCIKNLICDSNDNFSEEEKRRQWAYEQLLCKGGDAIRRVYILPQAEDADIYSEVILQNNYTISFEGLNPTPSQKKARKRPIYKIHQNIKKYIDEKILKPSGKLGVSKFKALTTAADCILNDLTFVVITTKDDAAAFKLFETLNDRGLRLSAADLVKNAIFKVAKPNEQSLIKDSWESISELIGNGNDLVSFLRTLWLTDQEFVRKDKLFDKYKGYIQDGAEKDDKFVQKLLDRLKNAAEHYKEICSPEPNKTQFAEDLIALNNLGAKTCRPLLLLIKIKCPSKLGKLCDLIERLTVRWMICRQVFNELETAYAQVSHDTSNLIDKGKSSDDDIYDFIEKSLKKLVNVPDDEVFSSSFIKYKISTTKPIRHILCEINSKMSPTREIASGPKDVHVEHVFPQQPSEKALKHSNIKAEDANDISPLIGNLTLLDGDINAELQNKAFPEKKSGFENSKLAINDSLKKFEKWTEHEINERAKEYSKYALQIWHWRRQ